MGALFLHFGEADLLGGSGAIVDFFVARDQVENSLRWGGIRRVVDVFR